MYLHFMHDSAYNQKFIEDILTFFNIEEHVFVVITDADRIKNLQFEDRRVKLYHVRVRKKYKLLLQYDKPFIKGLIDKSDKIYIHFLDNWSTLFLNQFAATQKIFWIIWGADLYNYVDIQLYDRETLAIAGVVFKLKLMVKQIKDVLYVKRARKKLMKRLDFICSNFYQDYSRFKETYPNSEAQFLKFLFHIPVDPLLLFKDRRQSDEKLKFADKKSADKIILIGNSADVTNNHVTILKYLAAFKEQNFNIICPLSYGDMGYARKIEELGRKLFGSRFIPLSKRIEPEEYFHMLNRVDVAIMHHNRQQAFGNIVPLLYIGKKVYMKETSSYVEMTEAGMHISRLGEKELLNERFLFQPYDEVQQNQNRNILDEILGEEKRIQCYEELFNS